MLCFYRHSVTAEVQYKQNCPLISIIKLNVSSVYTYHHKASLKTVYIKDKYYTLGLNFMFCSPCIPYNRVKKNQLDSQLILSIFPQPLNVSGVSRAIIRRYNHMYTAVGTYYSFLDDCCPGCIGTGQQTVI